jgi:hypothetical protein
MQSEIAQAVNDLIKSGEPDIEKLLLAGPTLTVEDIYPHFKHLFSPIALLTMNNKGRDLLYQYNRPIGQTTMLVDLLAKLGLKQPSALVTAGHPRIEHVRDIDIVMFFGSRAEKSKLDKAIEKVILTINDVASKGFTKVSLLQLGLLKLTTHPNMEQQFIVLSYVSMTKAGEEYVKQYHNGMTFPEGGVPARVEYQ